MVPCIELCYDISNHVSSDRSQAITTCHQIITFHQARSSPSDPCLHKLQQACQSDSVDPLPSFSLPLRCSHGCRCNQVYSSCSQLPSACPYPTFCLRPLRSYQEAEVGEAADQVEEVVASVSVSVAHPNHPIGDRHSQAVPGQEVEVASWMWPM